MPFLFKKGNLLLKIKNLPSFKELEIVENRHPDREYEISISVPEFNCVCPKTGLPDFANIQIRYIPNKSIVELKSLKLYMVKFRNVGIYHEYVTNIILDDFKNACNPKSITVVGDFHPRGGIKTTITTKFPN
tara:strand:- start:4586 stop:4981 length:396 start_codon:yes stop_codon:yes gene_type:complete